MRIKKLMVLITFAAMLTVACSGAKSKESDSNNDTTVEQTTAPELVAPASYGSVKLGEYKGIKITMPDTTVTDEEVERQIEAILLANPDKIEVTDRNAELGDTVNIDYVGKKDGVEFDGGKASGSDLDLGSNSFIPGFEDGLVGAEKGETRDLDLTFPKDYHNEELAGQKVVFTVTVNGIYEQKEAELTDAWVEKITAGEQKTVEEYRAFQRESAEQSKKLSANQQAQQQALKAVIDSSEFSPSQEALDYEFQNMVMQYKDMAGSTGQEYETFVKEYYSMTKDEFETELKTYAEEIVKQRLVIDEIANQEKLVVEEKDYEILTELYGQDKESLIASYGQEAIDSSAKLYKVVNFLVENAEKTIEKAITSESTVAPTTEETTEAQAVEEETTSVEAPTSANN